MLTDAQRTLRDQLKQREIESAMAQTAYHDLRRMCTHVYERRDDSAVCVICGVDAGWWCPKHEMHLCVYTEEETCDTCVHCGQPEERK